jgi:hypothetical protein
LQAGDDSRLLRDRIIHAVELDRTVRKVQRLPVDAEELRERVRIERAGRGRKK